MSLVEISDLNIQCGPRDFSCEAEVVSFRVIYLSPLILGKFVLYSMFKAKKENVINNYKINIVKDRHILCSVNL